MIDVRNRQGYIGGSDAVRVHGSYETKTFKSWWAERLTGISTSDFSTYHTSAGNIMEAEVLQCLKIPESAWSLSFKKEGTIAGVNTDAYYNGEVHEIKTVLSDIAYKWIMGGAISSAYMYQLKHAMYVTDAKKSHLHICVMSDDEKRNPFQIESVEERIFTFSFDRDEAATIEYGKIMNYLTACYNAGVYPSDEGKAKFINHFNS